MSADRDLARLRATYPDVLDGADDPDLVRFLGTLEGAHAAPVPPPRGPARGAASASPVPALPWHDPAAWSTAAPRPHYPVAGWGRRAVGVGAAALLVVALLVGALALARGRLTPAAPAATRLLYPGALAGRAGIVAAAPDDGGERLLVAGDYAGVAPSPDGRRFLAYGVAGTAAVVDLYAGDGRLLRRHALGDATPLIAYWAPDARHVALLARSGAATDAGGGRFRTWLLDDAGAREVTLGAQVVVGTSSGAGAWSRDGRLFLAVTPGDQAGRLTPGAVPELWTVDATGGDARRLPGDPVFGFGWSADGGTIYAIAGGGATDPAGAFTPGATLLLAVDGRTGARRTLASADDLARRLRLAPPSDGPLPDLPGRWTVAAPAVAPGGDRIALWLIPALGDDRALVDARPYLAVVDGEGRVTAAGYGDPLAAPRFTVWSPDGRRVIYAYTANTAGSVASLGLVAPTPAGEPPAATVALATALGGFTAEETSPRWSPDGRALAFLREGRVVLATGATLADTRALDGAGRGWPAWQMGTAP